jgi:hypothetical protein
MGKADELRFSNHSGLGDIRACIYVITRGS